MKNLSLVIFALAFSFVLKAQTVTIGSQVWMAKNLDVSTFRNGVPIPQAKTDEEWSKAGENHQPAWCYYDNDPANGAKYGKLYNWYAVNDPRGLAPIGYHIPSNDEWQVIEDYLGENAGDKMKNNSGWYESGNGNNSSGFIGLPGGFRYDLGGFEDFGHCCLIGNWWSRSEYDEDLAHDRALYYDASNLLRGPDFKGNGYSVRCLKD